MDAWALELLELPAILEQLASLAASGPGTARALELAPSADVREVQGRQQRTTEAIALLDHAAEPELGGVQDVRPAVALAGRGGELDPAALRAIAVAVRAGVAARSGLVEFEGVPCLQAIAEPIEPGLDALAERIDRAVEEDGSDLRDNASPTLRRLRRELREGRARLAEHLRKLARDPELRDHLQDDFVTERAAGPSSRSARPHGPASPGSSTTRRAPGRRCSLSRSRWSTTRTGCARRRAPSVKRWRESCAELSRDVGSHDRDLTLLVEAVGELDLALACGMLSRRWRGALW